jgi:hypothetical protein
MVLQRHGAANVTVRSLTAAFDGRGTRPSSAFISLLFSPFSRPKLMASGSDDPAVVAEMSLIELDPPRRIVSRLLAGQQADISRRVAGGVGVRRSGSRGHRTGPSCKLQGLVHPVCSGRTADHRFHCARANYSGRCVLSFACCFFWDVRVRSGHRFQS